MRGHPLQQPQSLPDRLTRPNHFPRIQSPRRRISRPTTLRTFRIGDRAPSVSDRRGRIALELPRLADCQSPCGPRLHGGRHSDADGDVDNRSFQEWEPLRPGSLTESRRLVHEVGRTRSPSGGR